MIYTDERRIKAEQRYINGGINLRELSKEQEISIGTLNKWCKQYEWVKKRAKVEKRAMKKAVTQAVNRKSKELSKEIAAVDSLAASLEKAASLLEKALSMGMSVEKAYYAIHGADIQRQSMQYAADQAAQRLAASVQAGAARPTENGIGNNAPVSMGIDINKMSEAQRAEIRRRLSSGEHVRL